MDAMELAWILLGSGPPTLGIGFLSGEDTSADMLIKCGYFTFTNAAIEPHLINMHS